MLQSLGSQRVRHDLVTKQEQQHEYSDLKLGFLFFGVLMFDSF